MSSKPVLVLQLRRLGDLILTFPLLSLLQHIYPDNPIYVAAQRHFFKELLPFAPKAIFFGPERLPELAQGNYEAVINLSSQQAAAACAGKTRAELKLGRIQRGSSLEISGFWHLYRENLTQNNSHNMFHWADLFRMDLGQAPWPSLARELPPPPGSGRIGLFVGASEESKRPAPGFWVPLARRLAGFGFTPVLLGGPGEAALGEAIMAAKPPAANFCGKTSLSQLAGLIKTCDLLITPDTGPMHLADWLGTRVLNLSMGNVQPLETGPLAPGQFALQAKMSCAGCWQCQGRSLACKNHFHGTAIARLAADMAKGSQSCQPPSGLALLETSRDNAGLHSLINLPSTASISLSRFWQKAFLELGGNMDFGPMQLAAFQLHASWPQTAGSLRRLLLKLKNDLRNHLRKNQLPPDSFWQKQPKACRMFAGWLQHCLQNGSNSSKARETCMFAVDFLEKSLANSTPKG